jgi:catechol 2,3-dioxygenase-like lactoylglutathione lyase family enzyme
MATPFNTSLRSCVAFDSKDRILFFQFNNMARKMVVLDHVSIAVRDLKRSIAFYEAALAPLGMKQLMAYGDDGEGPRHVGFGPDQKPIFWLGLGEPIAGYVHVAFQASDREIVDAFHKAALAAGGKDNGAPGLRPHYHPGYYGAFVLDPDGCNIEAVHHTF